MAETKTRGSTKGSQGSRKKPQARSRGSTSKSKSGNPSSKSKTSSRSQGSAKAKSRSPSGKSNGTGRVDTARRAVESTAKGAGHTAKEAGQSVGRAASKAKVPLVAGGAALMGAAGGLAIGVRSRRTKGIAKAISRRPQVKVKSSDVRHAAREVGTFGAQVGRLASELQSAREANGKHRSPIEIVLEGLTARRSRA